MRNFISTLLICIAVPAFFRWLYSISEKTGAQHQEAQVVYPASKAVAIIRWLWIGFCTVIVAASLWRPPNWIGVAAGAALLGLSFFIRSTPIVLTAEGIHGEGMWGRTAFIPWAEIREIRCTKGNSLTTVVGQNGTKIYHAGFNADPEGFRQELKLRTNLPLTVIESGIVKRKVSYR